MDMLVEYSLLHLCSSVYQCSTENQVLTGTLWVQLEMTVSPERQQEAHAKVF